MSGDGGLDQEVTCMVKGLPDRTKVAEEVDSIKRSAQAPVSLEKPVGEMLAGAVRDGLPAGFTG